MRQDQDTEELSCYDPSERRAACYYMHLEDDYDGGWCGDDCPVREREEMMRDLDAIYGPAESTQHYSREPNARFYLCCGAFWEDGCQCEREDLAVEALHGKP